MKLFNYNYNDTVETAYLVIILAVLFADHHKVKKNMYHYMKTIDYVNEDEIENIRLPDRLESTRIGDCDCKTLYLLSYLYQFDSFNNGIFLTNFKNGFYRHILVAEWNDQVQDYLEVDMTYPERTGVYNHPGRKCLILPKAALYQGLYDFYVDLSYEYPNESNEGKTEIALQFLEIVKKNPNHYFHIIDDFIHTPKYINFIPSGEHIDY